MIVLITIGVTGVVLWILIDSLGSNIRRSTAQQMERDRDRQEHELAMHKAGFIRIAIPTCTTVDDEPAVGYEMVWRRHDEVDDTPIPVDYLTSPMRTSEPVGGSNA